MDHLVLQKEKMEVVDKPKKMGFMEFEREARKNLRFPSVESEEPYAFSGFLVPDNVIHGQFTACLSAFHRQIKVFAKGKIGEICHRIVNKKKSKYFLSGISFDSDSIEILMYSQISRPKPPFRDIDVLFEKIVDVVYLDRMVRSRCMEDEKDVLDLGEERYYVQAVILGFDSKTGLYYEGCDNPECYAAKVELNEEMLYECPKCENCSENYNLVFKFSMILVDPECTPVTPFGDALPFKRHPLRPSIIQATIFKEEAEKLVGKSTVEITELVQDKNLQGIMKILNDIIGSTVVLRLRAALFNGSITFSVDKVFL